MDANRFLLHRAASPGVWQQCPASLGASSPTALKAEVEHTALAGNNQHLTHVLVEDHAGWSGGMEWVNTQQGAGS